jgi:hypothetical protein
MILMMTQPDANFFVNAGSGPTTLRHGCLTKCMFLMYLIRIRIQKQVTDKINLKNLPFEKTEYDQK